MTEKTVVAEQDVDVRLAAEFERLKHSGADACTLRLTFPFQEYWQDQPRDYLLEAVYRLSREGDQERVQFVVARQGAFAAGIDKPLAQLAAEVGGVLVSSDAALKLSPCYVPKPWGQEIWFTGVEQRGVAAVTDGEHETLLPWVVAAAPSAIAAGLGRQLILLKILDPLPDPVYGDLYFELHQEKREVYVVTAVDRKAWPSGMGGIRFGFSDHERARFRNEEDFKAAYLESVQAYREVRERIDSQLDQLRQRDGVAADEPVLAAQTKSWVNELGEQLRREEAEARAEMERFTAIRPIGVGDVIQVPCYTPHSLLHGVRTVEFQTPVYERLILSFAQKVLTQAGWDTEHAVEQMSTATPEDPVFDSLHDDDGVLVERIVDFVDFEVLRYRVEPSAAISLSPFASYTVVMGVQGELVLGGTCIGAEQAALVPAGCSGFKITNQGAKELCFLLAIPKLPTLEGEDC